MIVRILLWRLDERTPSLEELRDRIFTLSWSSPSCTSVLLQDGASRPENTGPSAEIARHDAAVPNRSASLPPMVRVTSRVREDSDSICGRTPVNWCPVVTSSLVAPAHVTSVRSRPNRAASRCG